MRTEYISEPLSKVGRGIIDPFPTITKSLKPNKKYFRSNQYTNMRCTSIVHRGCPWPYCLVLSLANRASNHQNETMKATSNSTVPVKFVTSNFSTPIFCRSRVGFVRTSEAKQSLLFHDDMIVTWPIRTYKIALKRHVTHCSHCDLLMDRKILSFGLLT